MYIYIYIYIHIHVYREREREREMEQVLPLGCLAEVISHVDGWHRHPVCCVTYAPAVYHNSSMLIDYTTFG